MPIPDPLHYAKNLRGNILDHNAAVVDHEEVMRLIDIETIQSVLDLGSDLQDHSQLGRVRDVYVAQLFTLKSVCTLLEAELYPAAAPVLPHAYIFTLLYSTNLQNRTRVFLAKLTYQCLNLLQDTPGMKHSFCSRYLVITMAEPSFIKG